MASMALGGLPWIWEVVRSLVVMVTLIIILVTIAAHLPSGSMLLAPGRPRKAQTTLLLLLRKLMMLRLLKTRELQLPAQVQVTKRASEAPKDVDRDAAAGVALTATTMAVLVRSVDMVQVIMDLLLSLLTLLVAGAGSMATAEVVVVMDRTLADVEATSTALLLMKRSSSSPVLTSSVLQMSL